MNALPDQVALELGQRPEDVEDELAAGGGSVVLLGQPPIFDPSLSEDQDNFDQKRQSIGCQPEEFYRTETTITIQIAEVLEIT